jgi:hypothetical protein
LKPVKYFISLSFKSSMGIAIQQRLAPMNALKLELKFDNNIVHVVYAGLTEIVTWSLSAKTVLAELSSRSCNLLLLIREGSALSLEEALIRSSWYETLNVPKSMKVAWVEPEPGAKSQLQMMLTLLRVKHEVDMQVFDTVEPASNWLLSKK